MKLTVIFMIMIFFFNFISAKTSLWGNYQYPKTRWLKKSIHKRKLGSLLEMITGGDKKGELENLKNNTKR